MGGKPFTEEQKNTLRAMWPDGLREDILAAFPGKSWNNLWQLTKRLGIIRSKEATLAELSVAGKKAAVISLGEPWTNAEDDLIRAIYPMGTREEILETLPNRTWRAIRCRGLTLRLSRNEDIVKNDRNRHNNETNLRRHGVKWSLLIDEVKKKSRETNMKKRGVEYPTQCAEVKDKVRKTVQQRFGVDNVFQSEEIKDISRATNLSKYGFENPMQSEIIRNRISATNQERYGVINPLQLRELVEAGLLKKYGETTPLRVPELLAKLKATNIERYGTEHPAQNAEVQERTISTNMENYGFPTPLQSPEIKIKIRRICLEKYGVENPAKSREVQEKIIQTNLKKFGVKYSLQSSEVRNKGYETSKKNKSFSSSKEEISFLTYLKMFDTNTEPHVKHTIGHVIDYYMPKYDVWVQFDGVYWHGKIERPNPSARSEKIKSTKKNDQYQNKNIQNLIRFWSDDVQTAIKNGNILDLIEGKLIEKSKVPIERVCHQYERKIVWRKGDLKNLPFDPSKLSARDMTLSAEPFNQEIEQFIEKYEWLGKVGVYPKWCFTAKYKEHLCGVVLINEPTAYSNILGGRTPTLEALIQRGATASWAPKNLGSRLIMFSCKWMVDNTQKRAFTGYADPRANELGTIYQACGFDYLGNSFGNSVLYRHPMIKNGAVFSPQILKRTSSFRRWCRSNNICLEEEWFKDNGFKNLANIPTEIKRAWYQWIKTISQQAEKIPVEKKHKYVLILGVNKKERKSLEKIKTYTTQKYPSRY